MGKLPDEVLAHIFSSFECKSPTGQWDAPYRKDIISSYSTLRSLSRVCKKFHRIAEHSLYRYIFLGGYYPTGSEFELVQDLKRDPQLSLTTRQLCLDYLRTALPKGFAENLTRIFSSRNDLPYNLKNIILHELRCVESGRRDASESLQGLILLLTPRLKMANLALRGLGLALFLLGGTLDENGDYNPNLFEENTEADPEGNLKISYDPKIHKALYLHDLETLTLRNYNYSSDMEMMSRPCLSILLHPNLKALKLESFRWLAGDWMAMRGSNVPSSLTRLELFDCCLDPRSLEHILSRFKNLRRFTIDFSRPRYSRESYDIDLADFGKVLRKFGHHLTDLRISTVSYYVQNGLAQEPTNCIGSLKELTSLRKLMVSMFDFVGPLDEREQKHIKLADALPQSLEILRLDEYSLQFESSSEVVRAFEDIDERVCNMIKSMCLPHLCEVSVDFPVAMEILGSQIESGIEIEGWNMERTRYQVMGFMVDGVSGAIQVVTKDIQVVTTATRVG